jgi:hypothetical protein
VSSRDVRTVCPRLKCCACNLAVITSLRFSQQTHQSGLLVRNFRSNAVSAQFCRDTKEWTLSMDNLSNHGFEGPPLLGSLCSWPTAKSTDATRPVPTHGCLKCQKWSGVPACWPLVPSNGRRTTETVHRQFCPLSATGLPPASCLLPRDLPFHHICHTNCIFAPNYVDSQHKPPRKQIILLHRQHLLHFLKHLYYFNLCT